MQYIGKLDKNKLGKYKNKIITEEVIITEERIEHIKEHHPGDYEDYNEYIGDVIRNPHYILQDNKNADTILCMKTIEEKNIQIIIKLHTEKQEKDRKNSILTLWKVKTSTYRQLIRNREIIWKSIDKKE